MAFKDTNIKKCFLCSKNIWSNIFHFLPDFHVILVNVQFKEVGKRLRIPTTVAVFRKKQYLIRYYEQQATSVKFLSFAKFLVMHCRYFPITIMILMERRAVGVSGTWLNYQSLIKMVTTSKDYEFHCEGTLHAKILSAALVMTH